MWLDCQRYAALLPLFRSVLTAKDLKFRFHTSALPWLPKTWCSASALPLCLDCQTSQVPLPLCLYCQRSEAPRPHFRSALTAKNVKLCFRTFALPWLAKIWSSAFRTCSARTSKDLKFRFRISSLPGFPKIAVSLLHFRLILTAKALKIGFSTNSLTSLPSMGSSASKLPFCLDCKRSVASHFRPAFIPKDVNALLLCLDCQRTAS